MLLPDEFTQAKNVFESPTFETDAIERVPRTLDRRTFLNERRQSRLQQKQTDALQAVPLENSNAKVAWSQVKHLREENRRLRFEMDEKRIELQRLITEYTALQGEFDKEIAVVHNGHQQEIEHYQKHLNEVMDERNRLHEEQITLEKRYQELYHSFQDAVEEEAQKKITDAAKTLVESPESAPVLLQDIKKTVELQVRQVEDKHLLDTLYLKGDLQRMTEVIQQERQQIEEERQCLLALQNNAREQAQLRYKTLQERLRDRWRARLLITAIGTPLLLVALQYLFLVLLRVPIEASISFALIAPIVLCVILVYVLPTPLAMIKNIYTELPHKVRVKKED